MSETEQLAPGVPATASGADDAPEGESAGPPAEPAGSDAESNDDGGDGDGLSGDDDDDGRRGASATQRARQARKAQERSELDRALAEYMPEILAQRWPDTHEVRLCRADMPNEGDFVMCLVSQVQTMGVYVQLLEYGVLRGLVPWSELSHRRQQATPKHVRVGQAFVCRVISADASTRSIDLSKRQADDTVRRRTENRYEMMLLARKVFKSVATKCRIPLAYFYERIGWPLQEKYGVLLAGLQQAAKDPDRVLGKFDIPPPVREELVAQIRKQLAPPMVRLRADVHVTCFSPTGVNSIRAALIAGRKVGEGMLKQPIRVSLIAPPLYFLMCTTDDRELGIRALTAAIAEVERVITSEAGQLVVQFQPRMASRDENAELLTRLRQLQHMTTQVVDEDEDEDDLGELA